VAGLLACAHCVKEEVQQKAHTSRRLTRRCILSSCILFSIHAARIAPTAAKSSATDSLCVGAVKMEPTSTFKDNVGAPEPEQTAQVQQHRARRNCVGKGVAYGVCRVAGVARSDGPLMANKQRCRERRPELLKQAALHQGGGGSLRSHPMCCCGGEWTTRATEGFRV